MVQKPLGSTGLQCLENLVGDNKKMKKTKKNSCKSARVFLFLPKFSTYKNYCFISFPSSTLLLEITLIK